MKVKWSSELPSLLMLVAMFASAAAAWPAAADRIPVHWGLSGQPDRFGGKFEGLLGLPLLALGLYGLLLALPRIDPRRAHYAAFSGAYAILRTALVGFFLAMTALTQLWVRGRPIAVNTYVPIVVGALMLVLGSCLPKLKSNWFVGIRTPWTLSSEDSWRRTHRLGGFLIGASGAIILALSIARPEAGFPAILCTVIPAAVTCVIFSYFAWRDDPARTDRTE